MATQADEKLGALAKRMKTERDNGAKPVGETVTVREFLSWFGYFRRGTQVIGQIRAKLTELGLRTVPEFEF